MYKTNNDMNIGKYAFPSKELAEELIEKREKDGHDFAIRDFLVKIEAVMDGEEVIEPSVLSDKYSVDAVWYGLDNHPEEWIKYAIEVEENGAHTFAGMDYQQYKFKEHTEIILDTSM
jgi:hypothetical protein